MIQIKVNRKMPPYVEGQVVNVVTDEKGTPVDFFWQDRLNDAKIDGCCEIVGSPAPKQKTKPIREKQIDSFDRCSRNEEKE
jgi:hypothetical protein